MEIDRREIVRRIAQYDAAAKQLDAQAAKASKDADANRGAATGLRLLLEGEDAKDKKEKSKLMDKVADKIIKEGEEKKGNGDKK